MLLSEPESVPVRVPEPSFCRAETISSSIVAFGFAYFRFPGKRVLFGLLLASMMLPGAVTLVPNYLIWKYLGFLGTNVPLWGATLFGSAFYIFLMRQFYLSLPRDLFEAARVDGCSYFGLWRRIAFPLALPSSGLRIVASKRRARSAVIATEFSPWFAGCRVGAGVAHNHAP